MRENKRGTDGRSDRPTGGPTDRPTDGNTLLGDARAHPKMTLNALLSLENGNHFSVSDKVAKLNVIIQMK